MSRGAGVYTEYHSFGYVTCPLAESARHARMHGHVVFVSCNASRIALL